MIWFMYKSQVVSHFDSPLFLFFIFFGLGQMNQGADDCDYGPPAKFF